MSVRGFFGNAFSVNFLSFFDKILGTCFEYDFVACVRRRYNFILCFKRIKTFAQFIETVL